MEEIKAEKERMLDLPQVSQGWKLSRNGADCKLSKMLNQDRYIFLLLFLYILIRNQLSFTLMKIFEFFVLLMLISFTNPFISFHSLTGVHNMYLPHFSVFTYVFSVTVSFNVNASIPPVQSEDQEEVRFKLFVFYICIYK